MEVVTTPYTNNTIIIFLHNQVFFYHLCCAARDARTRDSECYRHVLIGINVLVRFEELRQKTRDRRTAVNINTSQYDTTFRAEYRPLISRSNSRLAYFFLWLLRGKRACAKVGCVWT